MKKRLLILIAISALMASCGSAPAPSSETVIPSTSSEQQPTEMRRIYELYLADGGTMSYEQWLATIKGEPGKDGASIRHGQGAPDAALGNDGDSYLNMENWDYYLKTGGSWIKVGNIKGAQGEQGPQGEKGEPGDQGQQGEKGDKGDAGVSIVSIGKTGSDGLLDTYTITYSDGSASTFVVANGAKGEQGIQGVAGKDGHTPSVRIGANGNWFVDDADTGIQAQGLKGDKGDAGADGQDGKSAYEIYKAAHPEYAGNEQQWLDDLVNGRLGTEEKVIYTVTFDLGYDDLSFTQKVEEGGKATKPEDPTREGYNFMDWVDKNQDHWVFNGYSITADMTLYAVWLEQAEYTVTLDANGGQCEAASLRVRGGSPFELPPASKEGYFFEGWYLDGNKVSDGIYTFASDVTLTAKWSKKYTITFDTNGGEPLSPITAHDTVINTLPTPVKNGYSFLGWSFDNNPISLPYANDGHEDMTLIARWREGGQSDPSSAKEFVVSDNGDGTATITHYLGAGGMVDIPSFIHGLKVVTIAPNVFQMNGSIKAVFVPGTFREIPVSAFSGCSALYSVEIGEGVESIGSYAFSGCGSLESVTFPDSVTSIGDNAFTQCESLTNIDLPKGLTSIGYHAFDGCGKLQYRRQGVGLFLGNKQNPYLCLYSIQDKSISSLTVPQGCKTIAGYAISECSSLVSVSLPNSLTSIGGCAFSNCRSLTSIAIPDSVTSIGDCAFNYCTSLESVSLADSLTSIGNSAFSGCSALASIIIPDSVTSIGGYAFSGCSSMTSIVIPASVVSIGSYVFGGCSLLTSISVDANNRVYDSRNDCNAIIETNSNTLIFGSHRTEIPDSVTSIGDYAFSGCSSLQSINIPDSVISIGRSAFSGCASLASISIPNSVTSIGDYAFSSCDSLAGTTYNGAVYLGNENNKFLYLLKTESKSITSCSVQNGCRLIASNAFGWHNSLASVSLPDSLVSIGGSAFFGCSSLKTINIPDSVTYIGKSAFYSCSSLTGTSRNGAVYLGNGSNKFIYLLKAESESITSCVIPNSCRFIGSYAFSNCRSLASIAIPDSVTSIDYNAFSYCSSLEFAVLPDTLIEADSSLFYSCSKLSSVFINGDSYTGPEIDFGSATVYYYAEQQPAGPGNYWHYVDDVPTPW